MFVEDESDEADFLRSAFEEVRLPVSFAVVPDPTSCMADLRKQSPKAELVLLDLDHPDIDCLRFLQELKRDPDLRHVPVLALTSHDDFEVVHDVYAEHAAACLRKPMTMEEYRTLAEVIYRFWFEWAVLCAKQERRGAQVGDRSIRPCDRP